MKALRYLLISGTLVILTSCNSFSIGGGVRGGSSGDVDVGVGVGVQL